MSEKRKRPNYTKELKQDAVKLVIEQRYSCLKEHLINTQHSFCHSPQLSWGFSSVIIGDSVKLTIWAATLNTEK